MLAVRPGSRWCGIGGSKPDCIRRRIEPRANLRVSAKSRLGGDSELSLLASCSAVHRAGAGPVPPFGAAAATRRCELVAARARPWEVIMAVPGTCRIAAEGPCLLRHHP